MHMQYFIYNICIISIYSRDLYNTVYSIRKKPVLCIVHCILNIFVHTVLEYILNLTKIYRE